MVDGSVTLVRLVHPSKQLAMRDVTLYSTPLSVILAGTVISPE